MADPFKIVDGVAIPLTEDEIAAETARAEAWAAQAEARRLPEIMGAGLAVTFTSATALSATYALDDLSQQQLFAIAAQSAAGLGFPGGGSTFFYPDASGTPREFTEAQFVALFKAVRDYVFAATAAQAAFAANIEGAAWPSATITIP